MDSILQIVEPDAQLTDALDVDARFLVPREGPLAWDSDRGAFVDQFGRRFQAGGGFYNQVDQPLHEGSYSELRAYTFPAVSRYASVEGLRERARALYGEGYGLVADGAWGIYEIASSLRGTEAYFTDLALSPDYAANLAERVLEEHLKPYYQLLLAEVGPYVQLVIISDDYGSQQGLLFSPDMFRRIFKPRLRRLVDFIHSLVDARVYIHSDGAIYRIIPDLIDAGIDGINPVQYTARGMDADRLKHEFGQHLGFFGGGIDNAILTGNSVEAVRRDAARQIRALAVGGGYLYASIHNIPPEAPPGNVVAFFRAAEDFGRYPL